MAHFRFNFPWHIRLFFVKRQIQSPTPPSTGPWGTPVPIEAFFFTNTKTLHKNHNESSDQTNSLQDIDGRHQQSSDWPNLQLHFNAIFTKGRLAQVFNYGKSYEVSSSMQYGLCFRMHEKPPGLTYCFLQHFYHCSKVTTAYSIPNVNQFKYT